MLWLCWCLPPCLLFQIPCPTECVVAHLNQIIVVLAPEILLPLLLFRDSLVEEVQVNLALLHVNGALQVLNIMLAGVLFISELIIVALLLDVVVPLHGLDCVEKVLLNECHSGTRYHHNLVSYFAYS